MAKTESVTESVFRKALELYYKYESFAINCSEGVCAGVCF